MTTADWIKQYLAGTSPQQPGTRSAMLAASGLQAETLDAGLEMLYNAGIVNRVSITRCDAKDAHYWLTGATPKPVPFRDFRLAGSLPARRDTTPAPRQPQPMQEETMPQPEQPRSRARLMLEYLAEHGSATGKELCVASGAESVTSYLSGPIKRGHVLVSNDWSNKSGKTYTVAKGITREQLLADARSKNVPPHKQVEVARKVAVATPDVAPVEPQSNVVEFKPAESAPAVPERNYAAHQVSIDADGQLVIQQPGLVRMVFPPEDTRRIKAFLAAIDLESLCA